MSPWLAYVLGVATPAIATALALLAMRSWWSLKSWLEARGWLIEFRWKRGSNGGLPDDYSLRRDIWWERALGPVFAGCWYREVPKYEAPDEAKATRWIGLGRTAGPCVSVMRVRELGTVPEDAPLRAT